MGRKRSMSKRDEEYEVPFRSLIFRWKGNSGKKVVGV